MLTFLAVAACGSDSTGPRLPGSLTRASAEALSGIAGTQLANVLIVKVADEHGAALAGVTVNWTVTSGGGRLDPASSVSNSEGLAQAAWTLGPQSRSKHCECRASGQSGNFTGDVHRHWDSGPTVEARILVQPSTVLANGVMVPPVQVQVIDANGNIVTSGSLSIALTVTPGTGTFGATLGGASTVTAVNGIASFGNLTIDRAGTGYTLTAAAPGVSTTSSVPFNALPFTVTFINSTFTPITLSVGGTPANGPLAAGGGAAHSRGMAEGPVR